MKERSPKELRGRSLGTKLSEAEYAQCEKSAARRGLTTGEWCRQVLLEAAAGPAQAPEAEVILSGILALPQDRATHSTARRWMKRRRGALDRNPSVAHIE